MNSITRSTLIFLFFCMPAIATMAQSENAADSTEFAQIEFEEAFHAFGDISQGEKVQHTFSFKNVGSQPLIIQNVLTTCGCTVPEWPKDPIESQQAGLIKVEFDSTSKIGRQNKVITIRSNSKSGDFRLRISAMVLPANDN